MLRGLFARRAGGNADAIDRPISGRIKREVRSHLGLRPEDAVTVSEIACLDPACPGVETVILVMRKGRPTLAVKIARPAAEITEQDLGDALDAAARGGPG